MAPASFIEIATRPRVTLLRSFLSVAECEHLIQLAENSLTPSIIFTGKVGEILPVDNIRNSQGVFLPFHHTHILAEIERRVASLVNLPVTHGESLQVIKYEVGQYYRSHVDYFTVNAPCYQEELTIGGQRIATCLMYLKTPEEGGETHFINLGLKVEAKRGNAILFYNVQQNGVTDPQSLHASLTVLAGEKWVATKWMREKQVNPRVQHSGN